MNTATAVIATIPAPNVLGQSIGCAVPLDGEMQLGKLTSICSGLSEGPTHDRVDINLFGGRGGPLGACLSVAFHFEPSVRPVSGGQISQRTDTLRQWIGKKFGVWEFNERDFPSRTELCREIKTPLSVM